MKLEVGDGADLRAGFAEVRAWLGVPAEFPAAVLAEAEEAARAPRLPERDATDIPFLTIDPPGARDLDQALHIERRAPHGYRVWYAIADVAAFVRPGGAVDAEAHRRVQTLYLPDGNAPLYPPVLSEDAASLLPGEIRPALLWIIDLDSSGEHIGVDVRRALIRSRERFDYADAQLRIDIGTGDERLLLLREVGQLRLERERERGGVSLPVPGQEIVQADGGYTLGYRALLPVEWWNAQISLLTGIAAAELMMYGGVGVLRILPDAPERELERLQRVAHALGVDWPPGVPYSEVIHGLDPNLPHHAAFLQEASELLRGAGYVAFEGGVPEQATHAAVAAEYAHVTAPLRRLVDRYAGEICLALVAGADVPAWVRGALPRLPEEMERGERRADQVERACVDLVEATLLRDRVGEVFDAVVVDVDDGRPGGLVQLRDPAVRARCDAESLPLGQPVRVRLTTADPGRREVRFALA
ncbi:Ribonuclease II [Carbonactinospora thermoautotrophica]|nr:RNB domain-containing ribonuclease [Carbonactinospora thermoautotrophica]KWX01792.1 Ribonuclease II [Carbonactinospora thermoautotrophica]